QARLQTIADFYTNLSPFEREETAIITATNRDRIKINDLIRENLKASGELGTGYVFRVSDSRGNEQNKEFAQGDRVVFLEKADFAGSQVRKDDAGVIEEIAIEKKGETESRLIAIVKNGTRIEVNPDEYNHLDHAYGSTTYKELSSTHQRVLANIDTKQYSVNSRNDLLSKLAGSEGEVLIYTDDSKGLYDSVKKAQIKISINGFVDSGSEIDKSFLGVQDPRRGCPLSSVQIPGNIMGYSQPDHSNLNAPPRSGVLEKSPLAASGNLSDAKNLEKERLLNLISDKVEYKNAAFSRGEFITMAMDINSDMLSRGESDVEITIKDLVSYFEAQVKSGYYIEMGKLGENTYFSTEQNIKIENEIYNRATAAKDRISGFDEAQVRHYLEKTTLNNGQKQALVFMTGSKDQVRAIQGAPGVGKSFMLNIAKNFYEEKGYRVTALAPSNKAVLNLKDRAGFEEAATIHSYLIKLQKEAGTWESSRDPL
ncbi:MAG: AAA family ATPase, partial [Candidatus Aminicenantes bacterium]|nr:AAA family ATPase [Candidatus Aminicenantes bacterium]